VCSLSWREPKQAQRPILATVGRVGPFQTLVHPLTVKSRARKAPRLGPKVRVEAVHIRPEAEESALPAIVNGAGLGDVDQDGLLGHGIDPAGMWLGSWGPGLCLGFDLPEAVPLAAVEVWNYNAEWQTTNGIRKADVAVSVDGQTWQTVLRGAEIAEAEGTPDYDEPTVLNLKGVGAAKVRLENLVPWGTGGKVGLSEVVFHQAAGPQAAPVQPEDGALGVAVNSAMLRWVPGEGATEHRVYGGADPAALALLGVTVQARLGAPALKPMAPWFWRVDEVQADGRLVKGRVACFETAGLAGWWKLDETEGSLARDRTGHGCAGKVNGPPQWTPAPGPLGRGLEFGGERNFVDCGDHVRFDFRDAMAVSAWVKVRRFDRRSQTIVAKGSSLWPGCGAWRLERYLEASTVGFTIDGLAPAAQPGMGFARVTSKRGADDGQWHHFVGLYSSRRVALYMDGRLEDSMAVTGRMARNEAPVLIGENPIKHGRCFNGWIADVRLYNCGLSAREIQALHRCESPDAGSAAK